RADGAGRRWGGSSRGAGALTVRSAGLGLPPGEQFAAGLLLAEWSSFHPQCQQMLIGLAHLLTGRDAEDLHDLVPVQVRADRLEFLLFGERLDAGLQIVVGMCQPGGLALVPRGAVRPGEAVQALQLV